MHCPIDQTVLVMTERSGIEIDYCPQCRGVWLDRGELDKLLERDRTQNNRPTQRRDDTPSRTHDVRPPATPSPYSPGYQQPGYHNNGYGYGRPKYKKRKSWLEEIFD